MGQTHVHVTVNIKAPIELVFDAVSDHEAMSDWPGVSSCRLVREGTPRNGQGAVREIRARGLELLEEVVHWEPPVRYDYTITRGLPVEHLGSVRVAPDGDGVTLTWDIRMSSRWPLVCGVVAYALRRSLPAALAQVKAEVEEAAALSPVDPV